MDLAAAIGRLIMPAVRSEDETCWELAAELARLPAKGGIGASGFLLFGGERETLRARLRELRATAGGPLLFAADFERGAGQQVRGMTRLPHLMAIGATGEPDLARRAGLLTARESRLVGVQLVFAPDCDLNSDPENPIINIRAFGDDPARVGAMATAWISGCRTGGALSCAKHYPGHGHTSVDSHIALPRLDAPLELLEQRELVPFALASSGPSAADSIMTAHMAVPALTGEANLPVTMSARAIDYLRRTLRFGGLVVTDALLMGGVTAAFDEAEAAVLALAAGCDVLLCPTDPRCVHEAVMKAVRGGRVPESRVREAVERFERAATRYPGDAPSPGLEAGPEPEGHSLAEEIASRALTRVRGVAPARPARVVVLLAGDPGEFGGELAAELHLREPSVRLLPVATDSPDERLAMVASAVASAARGGEAIAIAVFSKILAWKGGAGAGLPEREARLLEALCLSAPGAAVVSCGSPYLLAHARAASFTACAFSDEAASQQAVAAALLGGAGWPGRSPVALGKLAET